MGLVYPELSLDLRPRYVPETIHTFLTQVSTIADDSERFNKVHDFALRLEEEMNKIQVFKRELPLCMLLLQDALLVLKHETAPYKRRNVHQPVLEEFISLEKESGGGGGNTQLNERDEDEDSGTDKKKWMSSVQLWSAQSQSQNLVLDSPKVDEKTSKIADDDQQHHPCNNTAGSKGFAPVIHTYSTPPELRRKVDKEDASAPGLSLVVPGMIKHPKDQESISRSLGSKLGGSRLSNSSSPASNGRPSHAQPTARKQRRCWSPELHRRFVDSLTQLGGAQVATPKQIRELMRVDGLTNDEVKSHLQKYRLHTRRGPNHSVASTTLDQYSESSKLNSSQSGSPEGPLQFPGLTGGTSTTGGDSMEDEDEDDEKSESHSWKGHVHRAGNDDV